MMSNEDRTFGWSRGRDGADRLLVVLSDIEMGAGGAWDDFPHCDRLGELLLSYAGPEHANRAVDLVFNGDTFDLLKTNVDGAYPRHITPPRPPGTMPDSIFDVVPEVRERLAALRAREREGVGGLAPFANDGRRRGGILQAS